MAEQKECLDGLRKTAQEAFSGLRADEKMRLRILRASRQTAARHSVRLTPSRLVPAACGLLVLAIGGTALFQGKLTFQKEQISGGIVSSEVPANSTGSETVTLGNSENSVSTLQTIRAGGSTEEKPASRGEGIRASVQTGEQRTDLLFETSGREIPVICMNGAAYQLLKEPAELDESLAGETVGTVSFTTETPSLEVGSAETLSNCLESGAKIFRVVTLPVKTAVAAEINGKLRLFQRVSYAGFGMKGDTLSETLGISGQIREMTLSSAGTLSGDEAEHAFLVLLENSVCAGEDAEPGEETLTIAMKDGLQLQLTVRGDTLIGCGAWRCPQFFEAFRKD